MLALILAASLAAATATATATATAPATTPASGTRVDFHGWEAVVLRSPTAEAVVVPAIGRVMRFDLRDRQGQTVPGPFWNVPGIDRGLGPDAEGWINYGGDKAWPAPQSAWPERTGRPWPPPKTFDALPFTASVAASGRAVTITSAVDPSYGVRVQRAIALDPRRPVLTIDTTYEKIEGAPVELAAWTITQLIRPDRVFVRLPRRSAFPQGYTSFLPDLPLDLELAWQGRLLSLKHHPRTKSMIGSDGDALLWVGSGPDLLIENATPAPPPGSRAVWPNRGSHAQVYTGPGASPDAGYVELELLGPLHALRPGDRLSLTVRYTLIPRVKADPLDEAKRVLGQKR